MRAELADFRHLGHRCDRLVSEADEAEHVRRPVVGLVALPEFCALDLVPRAV